MLNPHSPGATWDSNLAAGTGGGLHLSHFLLSRGQGVSEYYVKSSWPNFLVSEGTGKMRCLILPWEVDHPNKDDFPLYRMEVATALSVSVSVCIHPSPAQGLTTP